LLRHRRHSSGEYIIMAEQIRQYRSHDPDIDPYDENTANHPVAPYRFGHSARADSPPENSVPLFLSDYDGEPDPGEFITPLRKRSSISSRILAGVSAAAAVAMGFALLSSDATRDIIVNAKASIATVLPGPSVAAQPDSTQLTARDIQLKDPARLSGPANQTPAVRPVTTAAVAPTRAEITNAYQSALQGRAPAAAAPVAAEPVVAAPVTAPPARKLAADELATLMNRAKALLAAGDIPPARLLLERAADAQEPGAALMLARTYDPDVLGTQDARNIIPDPATARLWYQRAAQLGSADAQRRLSQLQN
jgi:TPR repeat protein